MYLTEKDFNSVKGLLHYLNEAMLPVEDLAFDVSVIDSNGDAVGRITYNADVDGYVFNLR